MDGRGNAEGFEEFSEYYVDALRRLLDNYAENAYIVCNEDSEKAKEVAHWTYEQDLTAFENMSRKISRIER